MTRRRLAQLFVLIGALLILDRVATSDGWLWTGLASAGFLVAYARQRVRGLLVLGCVLAGISLGLLLGGTGIPGAFWVALGISVMAIDRVEPEPDKRTLRIGAGLTAFGVLFGVASSGWLDDARFAIVLILVGILLLGQRRDASAPRES
ncbi:MAG: hypothetical protein U5J97_12055 [Trueperaceae bacterium]|nr:hypothetical protein [Trueperaceae bacterium]